MSRRRGVGSPPPQGAIRPLAAAVRPLATVCASLLLLVTGVATPAPAAGQSLAERVAAAEDGPVRFAFEAREGVCGRGESVWIVEGQGRRTIRGGFRGDGCDCPCRSGPVQVELDRFRNGSPSALDVRVGSPWPVRDEPVTDLGEVPPAEAADYLLGLAGGAPEEVGEEAVFAATLAHGVETWPDLLTLARDDGVPEDTRRAAVFWVGQAAGEAAGRGLVSVIESETALELREHAVFALSQRDDEASFQALVRIARSNPEPELRKKALFWLGERDDDPRVLDLFEEILTSG